MKIAFVGASGYGNVGDNTYPIVLRSALPDHELVFYNSDLPPRLPDDVGAIVIGGGGLLHNFDASPRNAASHHFRCMKYYMDCAVQRGLVWGVLSCGVQIHSAHRREREEFPGEVLAPWIPWLRKAHFITLRSPNCVSVVEKHTERTDIRFYPDLAYLFSPASAVGCSREAMVTFVIAGAVKPNDPFCKHLIRLFKAVNLRIVWLSMGAGVDDNGSIAAARQAHPDAVVIAKPSPEEAYRQIAASSLVVTGRYHGMIFARTSGVPFIVPEDSPWKIRHEHFDAGMADASGHISTLRAMLGVPQATLAN